MPPKTIRYYEEIGRLPEPERTSSGYRDFDREAVSRLRFSKAAQSVGFSIGEIKEILAFRERGQAPCEHVTGLIERHERIEALLGISRRRGPVMSSRGGPTGHGRRLARRKALHRSRHARRSDAMGEESSETYSKLAEAIESHPAARSRATRRWRT
ncbi:MAG: MerR family transcriptional regulator [Actinomycetota bacterium]